MSKYKKDPELKMDPEDVKTWCRITNEMIEKCTLPDNAVTISVLRKLSTEFKKKLVASDKKSQ